MIYRYQFKNFFSFSDETEMSLAVSRHVPDSDSVGISDVGIRLSKAMAVMGANASGKTNLLKPLTFVHWFIKQSFRLAADSEIPLQSHMLHTNSPSEFEIEFDFDGALWKYQLSATRRRVLWEALYKKIQRYNYVFTREWDSKLRRYIVKSKGFGLSKTESEKVRQNASLISTAAQYGVDFAVKLTNFSFQTNIDFSGRVQLDEDYQLDKIASFYKKNKHFRKQMTNLLKSWDLGLSDIDIREFRTNPEDPNEVQDFLVGIHSNKRGTFELFFNQESSGTKGAINLLSNLLPVLKNGGLAVIDELEADLHPHMIEPILSLFFNESTNPRNAQIVFTCHAAEVLNLLHKSQVTLVEKDDEHVSSAWRLDQVQGIRADDNLYAKYMSGAYSAIPNI